MNSQLATSTSCKQHVSRTPARNRATPMKRLHSICLTLLTLASAGTASAGPVTFSFSGSVTDDPFGLSQLGAPISGSYTFDDMATDAIPSPHTGSYASVGQAYGFLATVDGVVYSHAGGLSVNAGNNVSGVDQYGAIAQGASLTLELFLQDATSLALSSDALPTAPLDLGAFGFRQFRLFSDEAQFLGTVDSLICTAGCSATGGGSSVPEPSSVPLLGAAALAAFLTRGTRRRST